MNCTISLTSLDSAYQIQGTSVSKTKVIQKKVNRIMKIMQSIIWYAYWIMLEIVNSVISDIIDVLPQKGSSYFTKLNNVLS